jgi:hypothetical protein
VPNSADTGKVAGWQDPQQGDFAKPDCEENCERPAARQPNIVPAARGRKAPLLLAHRHDSISAGMTLPRSIWPDRSFRRCRVESGLEDAPLSRRASRRDISRRADRKVRKARCGPNVSCLRSLPDAYWPGMVQRGRLQRSDFANGNGRNRRDPDTETGQNAGIFRGTEGSNPVSSSGESANSRSPSR